MQLKFARLSNVIGALVTSRLHFASTTEYNLDLEFAMMCFQIGFSPDCTKCPSIPLSFALACLFNLHPLVLQHGSHGGPHGVQHSNEPSQLGSSRCLLHFMVRELDDSPTRRHDLLLGQSSQSRP